ncbi:hypothetical protein DFH06DRAFT_1233354, partial [Mycena polygramma]
RSWFPLATYLCAVLISLRSTSVAAVRFGPVQAKKFRTLNRTFGSVQPNPRTLNWTDVHGPVQVRTRSNLFLLPTP